MNTALLSASDGVSIARTKDSIDVENILNGIPIQFLNLTHLKNLHHDDMQKTLHQLQADTKTLVNAGAAQLPTMKTPLSQFLAKFPNLSVRMTDKMQVNADTVKMLMQSTKFDAKLALETKSVRDLILLSEVYILRDGNGIPLPRTPMTVTQVSTAAPNFSYDQSGGVETLGIRIPIESDLELMAKWSDEQIENLLQEKWKAILKGFHSAGVQYPVLSAIGLGAFLPFGERGFEMRQMSASALVKALQEPDLDALNKFDRIILSIPCFDSDNANVFREPLGNGFTGYVISRKNMFDIAYALASKGCKAGILNPSDKEALSSGNLGQFWYDGHVALEEAFMYQTTMLFNNWAFTKEVPSGWLETVNRFSQS
jgi:hypothetical protein